MNNLVKKIVIFRFLLAIEFVLLCLVFPSIIIFGGLGKYMFLFLWAATAYCAYQLFIVGHENFAKDTWKFKAVNLKNMKMILPRWILCCVGMLVFMHYYDPERMFQMAYEKPIALVTVFLVYPVLSALPQELIFCSFLFHRYKKFFPTQDTRIFVSALVFAYAHVLYVNPVAPTLSFIAGLIFAHTYNKTRSLALVTIEHALYGNALFLIGLGYYFWSGALQ